MLRRITTLRTCNEQPRYWIPKTTGANNYRQFLDSIMPCNRNRLLTLNCFASSKTDESLQKIDNCSSHQSLNGVVSAHKQPLVNRSRAHWRNTNMAQANLYRACALFAPPCRTGNAHHHLPIATSQLSRGCSEHLQCYVIRSDRKPCTLLN